MSFLVFLANGPNSSRFNDAQPESVFTSFHVIEKKDTRSIEEITNNTSAIETIQSRGNIVIIGNLIEIKWPSLIKARKLWEQLASKSISTAFGSTLIGVSIFAFGTWYDASCRSQLRFVAMLISTLVMWILAGVSLIRSKQATDRVFDLDNYKNDVAKFRAAMIQNQLRDFDKLKTEHLKFDGPQERAAEFLTQNEKEKLLGKYIKKENLTNSKNLLTNFIYRNRQILEGNLTQLVNFLEDAEAPDAKTTQQIYSSGVQGMKIKNVMQEIMTNPLPSKEEEQVFTTFNEQLNSDTFQGFDETKICAQRTRALEIVKDAFLEAVIKAPNTKATFEESYKAALFKLICKDRFEQLLTKCSLSCVASIKKRFNNIDESYLHKEFIVELVSFSRPLPPTPVKTP